MADGMMVLTILVPLLYISTDTFQTSLAKEIDGIPNRCDPEPFNNPISVRKRSVDSETLTTDQSTSSDPTIRKALNSFERHNEALAKVYKKFSRKGGEKGTWLVTLFQPDRDQEFAKEYANIILDKFTLPDGTTTVYKILCSEQKLRQLCRSKKVAYIEEDEEMTLSGCVTQQVIDNGTEIGNWGQSRVDQRELPLDDFYKHDDDRHCRRQEKIFVYVMDSGVSGTRTDEFGDRLKPGFDVSAENDSLKDIVGHGTHIAGIIGSKTYGIAKGVTIFSVRASNNTQGTITTEGFDRGVKWIQQHVKTHKKQNRAIVNMAFATSKPSLTVNLLVNSLVAQGITVVTAAGNSLTDSCCTSPASANGSITVGCSTKEDEMCFFSNWGSCNDINAPGWRIFSVSGPDKNNDRKAQALRSGTSQSSAYVTGAAAVLMSRAGWKGMTPCKVKSTLIKRATKNRIIPETITNPSITTDKLLFTHCRKYWKYWK